MLKASSPPTPLVNPLAEAQAPTPDWVDCRLCGVERISETLPFPICAKCALAISDHIAAGIDGWMPDRSERTFEAYNRQRRAELAANACVYYVRRGDLVKIGTTGEFARRMREILPDEILAIEPGNRDLEQGRHLQFARERVGTSEWFRYGPVLREHVAELIEQHGCPPAASVF